MATNAAAWPWDVDAEALDESSGASPDDTLRERDAASAEPAGGDAASWDPFEVWLTRVKQPRDATTRK